MGKIAQIFGRENRFNKFIERQDNKDIPFYNGKPIELTTGQWVGSIASVLVGFLVLILIPTSDALWNILTRAAFLLIPLITFAYFTKGAWKTLFHKPTFADYRTMVGFFLLNFVVAAAAAAVVRLFVQTSGDAVVGGLATSGPIEIVAFYVGTGIQIMGEELFTIIPFLAVMYFFYSKGKVTRKQAIVWALVLSSIWFALAHLTAYNWNLLQVILVMGSARVVLTLAYVRTKNLWVSYGTHLLNDWVIFTLITFAGISIGTA